MSKQISKRTIIFISDSTGITIETLANSLLIQFKEIEFNKVTLPYINSETKAEQIINYINKLALTENTKPIVFSSIIDPKIRHMVAGCQAVFMDIFDIFMPMLEKTLESTHGKEIGASHGVVNIEKYQSRIDAINFTLDTDDGLNSKHYDKADIILLGVSRSGKTPTCLYLAIQFGIYAANYPITIEDIHKMSLPPYLASLHKKLYGLTIDPKRLHEIREERQPQTTYASLKQCQYEITKAETLYQQASISYINTTHYSIEEIATKILSAKRESKFHPIEKSIR